MDLKSILGYASGSPYVSNPYLDINTPEGLINMQNTPHDLLGIDNLGNTKKMKAGRKKLYKFPGNQVREIPMQMGGPTRVIARNITPNPAGAYGPPPGNLIMYPGDSLTDNQIRTARYQYDHLYLDEHAAIAARHPIFQRPEYKRYPLNAGIDSTGTPLYYSPSVKDSTKIANFIPSFGNDLRNYLGLRNSTLPRMQKGGYAAKLFKYIFDDEQDQQPITQPQAAATEQVVEEASPSLIDKYVQDEEDFQSAMSILAEDGFDNPYNRGFRTFSSYQEGRQALENQLDLYKTGKSAHTTGNETLAEATSIYAPPSENNTENYINFVSKKLGVDRNTPIKNINTKKWADAVQQIEGNKSGNNNPGNLRYLFGGYIN